MAMPKKMTSAVHNLGGFARGRGNGYRRRASTYEQLFALGFFKAVVAQNAWGHSHYSTQLRIIASFTVRLSG